jgi:hypothetical protein
MLRSASNCHVLRAPNASVRGRRARRAEPQQRLNSRGRCPPSVEAERELVQVDLKLGTTDTIDESRRALLKIADRAVRQGHDRLGSLAQSRAERLRARDMPKAGGLQAVHRFSPSV